MARQKQISLFSALRPTGVDQTAGAQSRAIAGLFGQVGDIAFQKGAQIREKQGRTEGALSVQRDEEGNILPPEKKSDFTIFGQAFNESAMLAHRAQIGIDTKEELDRIQNEHRLDPAAFKNAAEGAKKGMLKGMPDELAAIVGLDFDSSASSRLSQLNKEMFNRETEKHRASVLASVESDTDDVLNAARSGDTTKVEWLIVSNSEKLEKAKQLGLVNQGEINKITESWSEKIHIEDTIGQIERELTETPTMDSINKATLKLKEISKQEFKVLNAAQKEAMINSAEMRINSALTNLARSKSGEKAKLKGEIKSINSEIQKAKTNLNAGINVNPDELSSLILRGSEINRVSGENVIDIGELQNEIVEQQQVNAFSMQSSAFRVEQEAKLISLERSGKLSIEQGELLRRVRKANNQVNQQINNKGIEYYEQQGIKDIGNLKVELNDDGSFNSGAFSESLESRKSVTMEASSHYGVDLSPFTNFEAEQITRLYAAQDSQGKSALLGSIVDGLGDMSIPALAQINDKGAGVMALSGAILNDGGDPTLILQGQELLREPANRNLLPVGGEAAASFDREISLQLGTAFAMNASQRGATTQAVKAAYAAISAQEGVSGEIFDSKVLKRAIDVATGGIVEHNDFNISAPLRGMEQDDFEDVIDNLTPSAFDFSFQTLPDIDKKLLIEQIQDNGTFHDVGPGQYLVKIGDGYLVDVDGQEYIFDLRKVIEGLK